LTLAYTVLAANEEARLRGAHATVGRVAAEPNATNAIAASASAWLDARAPDDATLAELVDALRDKVRERAARDGTSIEMVTESATAEIAFQSPVSRLAAQVLDAPVL